MPCTMRYLNSFLINNIKTPINKQIDIISIIIIIARKSTLLMIINSQIKIFQDV